MKKYTKIYLFVLILFLFLNAIFQPQNVYSQSDAQDTTNMNPLKFDDESITKSSDLLPERISFMENFLWGEKGAFRKIGFAGELSPETREYELKLRRTMLTIHQTLGIFTWVSMAATVTAGQLWLDGKLDSPTLHRTLKWPTIIGYSLTGLLAIITPPPVQRKPEFSTITVHKTLAWAHFLGMVATPILGRLILNSNDYYKSARFHQIVGYTTFAIYTTSMLVILLFE
jgi:hypothetical protein